MAPARRTDGQHARRSRTAAATDARRRATQDALSRVRDAIRQARREKAQPPAAAIARRAGVSRSFIYDNPEARAAVSAALAEAGEHRIQLLAEQDDQREATWRERALNAEDALKAAHAEITAQRTRIGGLLGQVRDLEAE
jgi:small-conductance mechanosensitive channel